jgi:phage N-6-adenine-methyltransferase
MSALELSSLPPEPLTVLEASELAECEADITLAHDAVTQARKAMARIRSGKLYRAKYPTFEAYCEDRWGFSARHGHRLADEATVAFNVTHGSQLPAPESGRALRALSLVPDEDQPDVWAEAVAANGGLAATGSQVENVVAIRRGARSESPPTSSVERLPVSDITASGRPPLGDEDAHAAAFMQDFRDRRDAGEAPRLTLGTAIAVPTPPKPVRDGDEWFTPADYVAMAREVMGGIDLDPASCVAAQATVLAKEFYTLEHGQDGLLMPWEVDTLWLNPPYSNAGEWVERLVAEYRDGNIRKHAITLINAKTETGWFGLLWKHAALCFVSGRISFVPGDGGESQTGRTGSAIAYLGPNPERFREVYSRVGVIARRWEV